MKINAEGQITIPPDIQKQLGLFPSTEIQLEVIGDTLQIRKPTPTRCANIIAVMRGKATRNLSTDEIMQLTRDPS
ncbi:MAG: AbrB/MazE/SpoVT family DNA-binding domain-containing protein [Thermosynechococcaceae cyanobacterium MS004]|nr:AbrB/MazE/SpoVT family DNA-binding domain-containing protein [Thermosynechococcaceae cyanobacterium MS004]